MASRTTELQELQKTRQLSLEVFAKTSQNKKTCVASRAPDHVAVCFEFLQLFSRTRTCLAWVCTVCKFSPMYQIAYYTLSGLPGEWKFWVLDDWELWSISRDGMGSPRLPTLCVSELFPSLAQSIDLSSMAPSFFMRALWLCGLVMLCAYPCFGPKASCCSGKTPGTTGKGVTLQV